jgi:subtilase family serine protease
MIAVRLAQPPIQVALFFCVGSLMQAFLRRGLIAGTAVAVGIAVAVPQAASAATPAPRATLDAAPAWTAHASAAAHVPSGQRLSLTAVLKLRDAAGAEAAARAISDPSSASYRHYMTAAQWRKAFAPTDSQLKSVTSWLKSNGFTVTSVPANNRYVSFTGTAAQAEAAFSTSLSTFSKSGHRVMAPTGSVSVPTSIAGTVEGISGLDTSSLAKPMSTTGADSSAAVTGQATASKKPGDVLPPPDPVFKNGRPCSAFYGEKAASSVPQILADPLTYAPCGYKPAQLRGAYGLDQSQAAGYDGRGVTVAVVDAYASPFIYNDVATYAKRNDPSHPFRTYQFNQILPATFTDTDLCGAGGWYGEETLDVEAVHAMAPAANVLYVGGSSCNNPDINAAVNTVVDNNLAQIITNSYGDAGEPTSRADVAEEHQTYVQAAAQGISVLFSSGDNGDEIANIGYRSTDYEASDSFVTAVGGTSLAVGSSSNYMFEQGWGTGKSILTAGAWSPSTPAYVYGGGGGTSQLFKQPWYQKGVVPKSISNYFKNGAYRAVPDVSMVGDPSTGFLVGQSQSFPDGSIRYSEYRIGGTSLSSPLFAGVTAVADQVAGGSLGFLNPSVYKLAGSSSFRDVNHGRAVTDGVVRVDFLNGFNAADGTLTSLRTLNQTGTIFTRPGYDDVTGVGSPNGVSFLLGVATLSHK